MSDAIVIVEYDPAWPSEFVHLRDRAQAALGDVAVAIEHVGSTAVPGLPAKTCSTWWWSSSRTTMSTRRSHAWRRSDTGREGTSGSRAAKLSGGRKAKSDTTCTSRRREALSYKRKWRSAIVCGPIRPSHAKYVALKRELAARHRDDRNAYTEAKTEFIEATLGLD
jgi:hypothetical protein